ncbi:RNA 2',3'-cyclic phosphodiesterase [Ammoniphilus sp. 3BR4]|uniref:RNA 2',3'-cyclic phosphodiesterase n=1 Tax=Ammoniphilus sp. 3BR4 TaxID=3158265 RepID=UPI003466B404
MDIHYFLAVPIPISLAQRLADWLSSRHEELPFKNKVVAEDYHITLHFLGRAEDKSLSQVIAGIPKAKEGISSFSLQATHFGYFGEKQSPRIFWVGTEHERALHELQKATGYVCEQAGFQMENRPYRPHITIARRWQGEFSFVLPDFQQELGDTDLSWKADRFCLYRSHMDRMPKYEVVESFPFT